MDIGAVGKGSLSKGGKDRKEAANATVKRSKIVRDVVTQITLQQTVLPLTRRAESVESLVTWQVRVDLLDLLDHRSPNRRVAQEGPSERRQECNRDKMLDLWREWCPLIPVPQEECPPSARVGHRKPRSQETTMIGAIGSYFDLGCVSEETKQLRLSMCGGHHVAASGGKTVSTRCKNPGFRSWRCAGQHGELVGAIQRHERWQSTSVDRPFSPLTAVEHTLQEAVRHSPNAHEKEVCLVPESEAQTSQRVDFQGRRRVPGGDVDEQRSRPRSSRRCRGKCASEKACGTISANSSRTRRTHSQRTCSVQNLVSRVLHRTRSNASTSCRRKRNYDSRNCH